MNNSPNNNDPHDTILPKLRPELVSTPQIYDDEPFWVYKDPLSLRYYRFNREEHFIIEQLRQGITLDQLKDAHFNHFKGELLTNAQVGEFIRSLLARNLVEMTQPDRDEILYKSGSKRDKIKIIGQMSNFLFIKIPIWDPDKFFDRYIKKIQFIWTSWFFIFFLVLSGLSCLMIIDRWADFTFMFKSMFLSLWNIPVLIVLFWLAKVWHEFGHGFTCKNFGGEVHEIGFLVLIFAPFMYCNISDSWTFRKKSHRLLTTSAGILSELLLAGIATVLWYFTEAPGFLHSISHKMIFICSVSTVLFNANPLLKFDGYYMLSDLIEVPNLRKRAADFLGSYTKRFVLGAKKVALPDEHKYRLVFPIYAISVMLYRWFIVFAISGGVFIFFKSKGLSFLGGAVFVFAVSTMLLLPLYKGGKMLVKQRHTMGVSTSRMILLLSIVMAFVGVALFWPMAQSVTTNFILEPMQISQINSEVGGILRWEPCVQQGNIVQKDQVLASLYCPELELRAKSFELKVEQAMRKINAFEYAGETAAAQYARESFNSYKSELVRINEKLAAAQIKAPFDGQILSLRKDIEKFRDKPIQRGTSLLLFADIRKMEVKVWVPEKMLSRIPEAGQNAKAQMMLYAFGDPFGGTIKFVSRNSEVDMGAFGEKVALSNKLGGEVLTEYDAATKQEKPVETVYEVIIEIDPESVPFEAKPYMTGRTRIDCGSYTIYQWSRDSLLRLISPEIRL
ncbi:MAG: HlyD family efflux transporter periplasmic adaptor subunit [Phycisphaerae bacterium]|nr:HlyD family efflux transporter periplasmic adaptor subunit [Phycisphaerae bacterium]